MENRFNDYKLIKILKKDNDSIVYLAIKNDTSFKYAVKLISLQNLTEEKIQDLENDCNFYIEFNSKFILKLYNTYQENDNFIIITEYCDGGFLSDFLHQTKKEKKTLLKEELIWKIFIQIVIGIYEIHSKNIIHRNLKPETLLLFKDFTVKIKNFKSAKKLNSQFTKSFIGTPYYISPEMYEEKPYNKKTDIWSLGIILYELCMLTKPYKADSQNELKNKILKEQYKPIVSKFSKELINMVTLLLNKNPDKRPSIEDIIQNFIFLSKAKNYGLSQFIKPVKNKDKDNKGKNNYKGKDIKKKRKENKNNTLKNNSNQLIGKNLSDTKTNISDINNNNIGITQFLGNDLLDSKTTIPDINKENEKEDNLNFTNFSDVYMDDYDPNKNIEKIKQKINNGNENSNLNNQSENQVKYTSEQIKQIKGKMKFIKKELEKSIGANKTEKLISQANDFNIEELSSSFKNSLQIQGDLKTYIYYKKKLDNN